MGNHRAGTPPTRRSGASAARQHRPLSGDGRPRARHAATRGSLRSRLLPVPALVVVAAVAVGSTGAMPVSPVAAASESEDFQFGQDRLALAAGSPVSFVPERERSVSRSSARNSLSASEAADAAEQAQLDAEVEQQARDRRQALRDLSDAAEQQAEEIEANRWVMPVVDYVMTSPYGPRWGGMHTGIDLAAPTGRPLVAVASGTVTEAAYSGGYGYKSVLTLEDGTQVWYAHQDSLVASAGDQVSAGDLIGYLGSTGNSTGPHLHLEIHPGGGGPVDPAAYLASQGLTV